MKRKIKTNEIKIGNDGYGNRNITVSEVERGVVISITDPHSWGYVTDSIGIPIGNLDELITFLIGVKQKVNQD